MTYEATLDYLYVRLPVFHQIGAAAYKPGLDNTIKLLEALGNPHKKFRSIHIAGTNGKGSVSHILSAIFQSAGYKTGLYTSPHLVDFGERIRINGQMIEQQYVIDFVESNKKLIETIQPSFFEATMAMSFCYFADMKVDIAIVEVGLGGRLDSTNIITPLLSVITNISFDHTIFLGNTLDKIAFEKAGIIKAGVPVVVGETLPETKPVFEKQAHINKSPLFFADENIRFSKYESGKMWCKTVSGTEFVCGLTGEYQLLNLATLLKAVEVFRQNCPDNLQLGDMAIFNGIANVVELTGLRGRWEQLSSSPAIVADTGHNVAGLSFVVEQLKHQIYSHLRIVIGMVNDKDIDHVLKLLPVNARYYFTQASVSRALPATELSEKAYQAGLTGKTFDTVQKAVNAAMSEASPDDFIFIGGSNFIVGEALKLF
ncbi:MAG: bifunctional folylpolyglutamate synthase/dihydrofolate synthase [Paludibacter sp.]|nr:bifunctional folylpolyglutamate synthase/dihydrofolate synthase [Paludibacter sp.]